MTNDVNVSDDIKAFAHCKDCLMEIPEGMSPQDYVWIECGMNEDDMFQVNCVRHNKILMAVELKNTPSTFNDGCSDCGCEIG